MTTVTRTYRTREERREGARRLCRRLSEKVTEAASPGLGHWDPAWRLVEDVSGRFLDALDEFTRTGDEDARHRAKGLAGAVLEVWKEADRRYREAGRPTDCQEVGA